MDNELGLLTELKNKTDLNTSSITNLCSILSSHNDTFSKLIAQHNFHMDSYLKLRGDINSLWFGLVISLVLNVVLLVR